MPAELQAQLSELHAASLPGGAFDGLAAASEARDTHTLTKMLDQITPRLEKLGALLDADGVKAPAGSLERAVLSAAAAGFLLQAARLKIAAALSTESPGDAKAESPGDAKVSLEPEELFDLVEILRVYQPGGAGLLATAADALSLVAGREGNGSAAAQAALQLFLKVRGVGCCLES